MMACTIIFQRCYYNSPQSESAVHNNSCSSLVKSTSLVFPPKKPSAATSLLFRRRSWNIDCLERRRMQSILDTSWSSLLLPSQISPWLVLPPEDQHDHVVYKFYSISNDKVISFEEQGAPPHLFFFKGSSHGWLAQLDSRTRDLFLYNPISRRRLKLPSMDTLPLRGSPSQGAVDFNKSSDCLVSKVILSSWDPDKDESCVAMMLYGADNRLACCHPAQGTRAKWVPLGSDRHWVWDGRERRARSYQDIAYSAREKLFFCITKEEPRVELEAWDSASLLDKDYMPISIRDYSFDEQGYYPWPRRCEREFYLKDRMCTQHQRYLVVAEPCGGDDNGLPSQQLFLVLRHRMKLLDGVYFEDEDDDEDEFPIQLHTVAFDVHRFDVRTRKLVYMDRTLDGLALFVGKNHSFAVEASQFDRLKPNSIYFTDPDGKDDYHGYEYGVGHDIGIYDYENATFSSCYYPCEAESIKRIEPAPMWFSPYQSK